MSSYSVKLSLGSLSLRIPIVENLKSEYGLDTLVGFSLHFLYLKPEYCKLSDIDKQVIDSKITFLLDYFPSLLFLSSKSEEYHRLNDLRRFENAKDSFGDLENALRKIYGNDATLYWIVPRKGVITGWSSRASSVMHDAELDALVYRAELGYVYLTVKSDNSKPLDELKLRDSLIHSQIYLSFKNNDYPLFVLNYNEHSNNIKPVSEAALLPSLLNAPSEDKLDYFSNLNSRWSLHLDPIHLEYIADNYQNKFAFKEYQTDPSKFHDLTDVELMIFAQINSEHCRHHLFRAKFIIDEEIKPHSLIDMIKNTYRKHSKGVITAYDDNSAVIAGHPANRFIPDYRNNCYTKEIEPCNLVIKAETHNHPTAISPFSGSATGVGGEIRDEAATGIGARSVCGFTGIILSNLNIPNFLQPWETPATSDILNPNHRFLDSSLPSHISKFYSNQKPTPPFVDGFSIISKSAIGSSAYSNEYGRPVVAGFFRTYTEVAKYKNSIDYIIYGYHKPVMLCGGMGYIRPQHLKKKDISNGDLIVVIGPPAISIGIGGGASSSKILAESDEQNVKSVPLANGLAGRICQSVINACSQRGIESPILSLHDVGAGGLSNAIPELVHNSGFGADVNLNAIPINDAYISPIEILCSESQERYVAVINKDSIDLFKDICFREKCTLGIIGKVTDSKSIVARDSNSEKCPVGLSSDFLFMNNFVDVKSDHTREIELDQLVIPSNLSLTEIACLLLRVPAVASKSFIITIGDRSVGGLIARDQMVGPWQVPVADCAVTFSSFDGYKGFAMALGEKPLLSPVNSSASARMAVCEAITNILSADIQSLDSLKMGANWMVNAQTPGMIASLYKAVEAIGLELCPNLKIAIPVGKDSTSMSMSWDLGKDSKNATTNGPSEDRDTSSSNDIVNGSQEVNVVSPVTVAISAYAEVNDTRKTFTPQLADSTETTVIIFIDLAKGNQRLSGSCLTQVLNIIVGDCPDVCDLEKTIIPLFKLMKALKSDDSEIEVLAYHDRSDGGLFTTILEMCFAGNKGCYIDITTICKDPVRTLFNEELGVVLQIKERDMFKFVALARELGFDPNDVHPIGSVNDGRRIIITSDDKTLIDEPILHLYKEWSLTSTHIKATITPGEFADMEFEMIDKHFNGPGLRFDVKYDLDELQNLPLPPVLPSLPRVAILREVGINGHEELAHSFYLGGFEVYDIHMHDISTKTISLSQFSGIAIGGGFIHGDVLGPGSGWAKTILANKIVRSEFKTFFERGDTFSIGFCNGCQFLSQLKEIIPGTNTWPIFGSNKSGVFESRLIRLKVEKNTPSIFLKDMEDSILVAPAAHASGRAYFVNVDHNDPLESNPALKNTVMTYVDNDGNVADENRYPYNPSGSIFGIAALTSDDGRVFIIMPHPERVHRMYQHTWGFEKVESQKEKFASIEFSPTVKMFTNAYNWICKIRQED